MFWENCIVQILLYFNSVIYFYNLFDTVCLLQEINRLRTFTTLAIYFNLKVVFKSKKNQVLRVEKFFRELFKTIFT